MKNLWKIEGCRCGKDSYLVSVTLKIPSYKHTEKQKQKPVTENNLYSVREKLENLCSYYIYKPNDKPNTDYKTF